MKDNEAMAKLMYTLGAAALTFVILAAFYGDFVAHVINA